jgi:hypothetical protein
MNLILNNLVQATPVFVILLSLSGVSGAPDDNRWAQHLA